MISYRVHCNKCAASRIEVDLVTLNQDDVSGDFIVLEASVALADSLKLNSAHRKNRRNESIELIKAAPRATCSQSLENVA